MSETQRNHEEINKLMTNQKFGLLRDKLAELKADTDPHIFQDLSGPNQLVGRGFRYQAYEEIVERIVTFFREHCTLEWYPNNAVERPLDELVSEYSGSRGALKLKRELATTFASTSVRDNCAAKHRALARHNRENGEGHLFGFGVAKFRKWMNTNDQKHAPPPPAKKAILSFMKDMRNPRNNNEEEYKQGRVTAMCFTLLLMKELMKAGGRKEGYINILGAGMIHALTTHANPSQPIWEHICDVIYPPQQHEERTVFYNFVAACTMGEHHRKWGMYSGYWKSTCLCSSGCLCNETFVSAEDSLGFLMRRDVIESLRNWEAV